MYLSKGLAIFCIGFWLCLFQGINTDDETWFLQVVHRVLSGEVLYRDVYFGATPLSVYVATFFCSLFGAELLVARAVLVLYFTAGVLLSCAILKELRVSSSFSLLFVLAFFVFAHAQVAWGFSGYNGLAKVFFLSCMLAALKWSKNTQRQSLLGLAGIFAGLCFGAKQNVGLIALLVLLTVAGIALCRLKGLLTLLASFFLTTALVLLPTLIGGGWEHFIDYAWLNKSRYLAAEHCNYFLIPHSWDSYSTLIFSAPLLLPTLFILAYKRKERQERTEYLIVTLFLLGALLNLYPRPDNFQKMTCIPFMLIGIAYCYCKIKNGIALRWQRTLRGALATGFSLVLLASLIIPMIQLYGKGRIISQLPHLRGIMLDPSSHQYWECMKKGFAALHTGERCFFLSTHAGLYYLLLGIKNPTPFDYPIHSALGCHGEREIIQKIQTHQIDALFMDHPPHSNWGAMKRDRHPFLLEAFLRQHMQEVPIDPDNHLEPFFQRFQVESAKKGIRECLK